MKKATPIKRVTATLSALSLILALSATTLIGQPADPESQYTYKRHYTYKHPVGAVPDTSGTSGAFSPSGHFWGYAFGDIHAVVQGSTERWGMSEYAGDAEGDWGGRLRRIYLGYDYQATSQLSGHLLLEGNAFDVNPDDWNLFLKQAYLEWNPETALLHETRIRAGLVPTGLASRGEDVWGYRPVEREVLDARDFGTTIDQGVSLSGKFDESARTGFMLMAARGAGRHLETDSRYELYGNLHYEADEGLMIELMGIHREIEGDRSRTTLKGLVGWHSKRVSTGLILAQSWRPGEREAADGRVDTRPAVASLFANLTLLPRWPELTFYARADYYDPDRSWSASRTYLDSDINYSETQFIAGLHWAVNDYLNLMPNLHINRYHAKDASIDDRAAEVVPRLTLFVTF